jgi:hypothetical protein
VEPKRRPQLGVAFNSRMVAASSMRAMRATSGTWK